MLKIAKSKVNGDVNCIQADFNTFEFPRKYSLIVSSLALHHLETDKDKPEFYKKIYLALTDDGIFINLDVVLGSNDAIQNVYIDKWKEFMQRNVSEDEVLNKWLPNYYAEDRPTQLVTHLDMLRECGFFCVDIIYKYFNYAVFMGEK